MTLRELIPEWLEDKRHYIKESSIQTYLFRIKDHILPELGDLDVKDFSNKTVQNFLFKLMDSGLSRRSAGDGVITLKMILRYAMDMDYIPEMTFRIKYPTANIEEKKHLIVYSGDEQKKIINYLKDNPSFQNLALLICFCTGMRIGEICGLRFEDIDLEQKCIHIRRQVQRIYDHEKCRSKKIISTTKTQAGNRDVPVSKDLYAILKHYKKIAKESYYVASGLEKSTEPRTFRNYYKDLILNKIKLNRCITFHVARHSFASRMIEMGVDVKTTSKILGHTDVGTTMNLYVHPTAENKMNAVNKSLNALFK